MRTLLKSLLFSLLIFGLMACNNRLPIVRQGASDQETTPISQEPNGKLPPIVSSATPSQTVSASSRPKVVALETSSGEIPAGQLRPLSIEEQLGLVTLPIRDIPAITVRLRPDVTDVPLVVNATAPDYQIGDRLDFWVHNPASGENSQIRADLVYKSAVAYGWVEQGQQVDTAMLTQSLDRFSNQIYPQLSARFGSESKPGIDNDPRLHVLHTSKTGSGLAGYYSSADEYSRLTNPYSNEKEMFYINSQLLNSAPAFRDYEMVLAHEFQHMIHWNQDRNEGVWMNEGLSEFAQDVAGYVQDTVFVNAFLNAPDTQLNAWGEATANNTQHYGASYLLVNYLSQRFGDDFIQSVVSQQANGIAGINQALAQRGLTETLDFNALFADWVVANYADAPDALGQSNVYGYREVDPAKIPTLSLDDATPQIEGKLSNYATHYIELKRPAQDLHLRFQGNATTRLAPVEVYQGNAMAWGNRGDESDSQLTRRFDLRSAPADAPIQLEIATWWDIEVGYDYGYVLASLDGKKWQTLTGQHTTDENRSGNNYGSSYSGQSDGWQLDQFDLSPYRGQELWLRFEYVTDDAVTLSGWMIDQISIPAIGYHEGMEGTLDGWLSNGWLITDNVLPQKWLVQAMILEGNQLVGVQQFPVDATGSAEIVLKELGENQRVLLAISGLTQATTEVGSYQVAYQ